MKKEKKKKNNDGLSCTRTDDQSIFKTIFELANDIIIYVDKQGTIVDVNGKVRETLGYEPEELKGRGFTELDLFSPKDASLVLKLFQDAVKNDGVEYTQAEAQNVMSMEIKHKNGNLVFMEASTINIREGGKLKGFVSVIRDITEQKQTKEKQREIGKRFRNLFDNCPLGVYRTTPDGRILSGNPVLVHMLGYSSFDELSSRNLEQEGFEPDYPRSEFKQIMESRDEVRGLEAAWIRQDGSTIFVRENAKAVRDEKGNILYYEGTVEDITERKRIEEARNLSEERLRRAQAIAKIGDWDWDIKNNILLWSDELYRIFGIKREDFKFPFEAIESLIHPQDREMNRQQVKELLDHSDSGEFSFRIILPDGKVRHINQIFEVVRHDSGKATRAFGTMQDVTEREWAEEKHRTIIKTALDGFCIITPEGKLFEVNDSFCRMIGYNREELLEMSIQDIEALETPQEVSQHLKKVSEQGFDSFETRQKRKDGKLIDVEVSVNYLDLEGGQIFVFLRDITERRHAHEKIRASEAKYRRLVDDSADIIFVHDLKGKLSFINKAACDIIGYSEQELIGTNVFNLVHREDSNAALSRMKRIEQGEAIRNVEYRLVAKDGSLVYVLTNASPIFDSNGKIIGVSGIAKDITERKQAEEEKNRLLHDLGERVKELNCLFEIEKLLKSPSIFLEEVYQKTADLMLPAWEFPEIACARITVEGREYTTADFKETKWKLKSRIVVHGKQIGTIELCYRKEKPDADDGPFLNEEKILIDVIAERLGETIEYRRAEVALKEERNKLKAIVESMDYGLTIHDRDYRIIYQNETLIKQVGEYLGEKCYWAYEHRRQICDECPVQLAWEDGNSHTSERKVIMPSGEITFWENTASPIRDAKGEIVACLEITRNITERKKTDEALKKSEANFREAQRIAHMGSWSLDLATNKISLSEEMMDIYKLPKSERSGELDFEVWEKYVHPEDKKKVQNAFENALSGERLYDIEFRIFRSDNKLRILHTLGDIVKDQTGRPVGMIGTGLDVTERRLAEEELRESEQKYRDLVENINDVIYSVDQRGIITYISPVVESITGYKPVETIGRSFSEFVHPEDMPEVIRSFEETKSGRPFPAEYRIFRKNSQEIWIRTFSRPVFKEGKYRGLRGVMTDVTERKRLLQQLIQSEKAAAVGTLAYGIAHEFNNILAGIMANAEYGASIQNMEQIRKCFKVIVENSQRGSSITNSLLTVAGERKGKRQISNITQPLRNILSFSRRELEKANIKIVEDLKPVPEILCDPGQFSEVFLNMINNARDAMLPQGGTLMIRLDHYLGNIRIIFKDTGCGIPDEIKDKIFDPFVTTKGALGGSDIPGTGLGLYLTLGIVDSYGGQIDVLSHVGKGTNFTILIPISKNLPYEPELEKDKATPEDIRTKLNILLIDDEEVICRALTKYLESKGHMVTASIEALDGLEHFQKNDFDIVLSDITMPGMDGIELIKEMKQRNPDVKIIAITGHVHKDKLEQAKNAGAEEVLTKPFKSSDLYKTIVGLFQGDEKKDECKE